MRLGTVFGVVMAAAVLPAGAYAAKAPAVSGIVWNDANRDGVRGKTEPVASGVSVKLERKDGAKWKAVRTVKTGKTGRYSAPLTARGTYRVTATRPAGTAAFSAKRKGKSRTLDSDVNAAGQSSTFARRKTTIDIGLLPAPPTLSTPTSGPAAVPTPAPSASPTPAPAPGPGGTVSGRVWREVASDGRRATDEPAVPVSTVQLWNESRTEQLASTSTDPADGTYSLTLPTQGVRYRVRVVLPNGAVGYAQKDATPTDADDSDLADVGDDTGFSAPHTATGGLLTLDAGLRFHPPVSVNGRAWRDDSNDGIYDEDDGSVGSRPFEIWTADRSTLLATTPGRSDGSYTAVAPYGGVPVRLKVLFGPYPVGRYRATPDQARDSDFIQFGDDDGWTAPIMLGTTGAPINSIDAALVSAVSLGDRVWNDTNINGIQDPGETGVAGMTVEVWDNYRETKYDSVVTNAAGSYQLRVRGGAASYCLRFIKSNLRSFTLRDEGENEQEDSDVAADGWVCRLIPWNTISTTTIDAGLRPLFIAPGL